MSAMETMRVPGPWTVADRDALPDDGKRHELIDGVLYVNAAPRPAHQGIVLQLATLLLAEAPTHLKVHVAPLDVVLADDTVVEPDVLVAPAVAFNDLHLPGPPLLAVEVLSPSTRRVDLLIKKERYERAGIASYWVIDTDTLELTVHELTQGGRGQGDQGRGDYVEVARVGADDTWTATRPFAVTITPRDLRY
ncbi:Uma2 family endonuclease [Aeromicrobium sp. Leaf350]|uniref:Uma2 family endonuclease n=1 Tax=Aeromicrobium sp. Leaf350 TaxID=2876565 RepID=UPI001E3B4747|nr:Uma2 family endonuclease [Aeromicrobium sp. Leaf350]